jgi:hypothetical protein
MERPSRRDQDRRSDVSAAADSPGTPDPEAARGGGRRGRAEARHTDLLSLALVVFFVVLIGVVAALLVVPVVF